MSNLSRDESLGILRWLIEVGADEAIAETPMNRFGAYAKILPPLESEDRTPRANATARRERGDAFSRPTSPSPQPEARTDISAAAATISLSTAPGAARALAASSTTLAELRTALHTFDGCELKRYATNTVFADGTPEGGIMLIGEAPGYDEDQQGLPFVGRAGKLLDRMLAAISLDRTKVYITNVLNWRPPQNREPSPEEAAACLPFLHRHIELAEPQILILLGAVSVRHVLGLTEGIMRVRGRWNVYQSAALRRAIPVMPTLHPAYLLRQPSAKRLAWRDLCSVAEKIDELGLARNRSDSHHGAGVGSRTP